MIPPQKFKGSHTFIFLTPNESAWKYFKTKRNQHLNFRFFFTEDSTGKH